MNSLALEARHTPNPSLRLTSFDPGIASMCEPEILRRVVELSETRLNEAPSQNYWIRWSVLLICCVGMLGTTGCGSMTLWRRKEPQLSKAEPPLSATSTSEEILARINENAYSEYSPEGLKSYRCDDVRVRMQGIPAPMRASIVVEAPRNLRLRVANPLSGGEAVDIGSNEQQFWFWAKDSRPANVLVCSHDQIAAATQVTTLPLPFRPDWLMEVLGVAPISGTGYEVRRPDRKSPVLELVSVQRTPDQQPVRRFVKVNMTYGVVLEHRVESMKGQMIAKATLSRHFRDPETRLILPRQISIDWPAADQQLALSLEFQNVNFNSPAESMAMWKAPQMGGYPEFDIGEYAVTQLGRDGSGISESTPRNSALAGRSRLEDDSESQDAVEVAEVAEDSTWSDPDSLLLVDRPIRTASEENQSLVKPEGEIENREIEEDPRPANSMLDDSPADGESVDARPFPGGS